MKFVLIYILLFCAFLSCTNNGIQKNSTNSQKSFVINGTCTDNDQILYLFISKDTLLSLLDSSRVLNNKFKFNGAIPHPSKALIQLRDRSIAYPFILTNESFNINLNISDMTKSMVTNSDINKDFTEVRKSSSAIYKKIDYLFPQLQKARMENDFKALEEINQTINKIELENLNYLYNFINEHPKKELSGLLLNELWHSPKKDSTQLNKLARNLSPEIKKILNFPIH